MISISRKTTEQILPFSPNVLRVITHAHKTDLAAATAKLKRERFSPNEERMKNPLRHLKEPPPWRDL